MRETDHQNTIVIIVVAKIQQFSGILSENLRNNICIPSKNFNKNNYNYCDGFNICLQIIG